MNGTPRALKGGPTSPAGANRAERLAQALTLRRAGASYSAIGREMGINKGNAHRLVADAIKQMLTEPAEHVRALENDRLDALHAARWRDAIGAAYRRPDGTVRAATPEEQDRATRTLLLLSDRRAKLNGLDQPKEIRIALSDGQLDFMETVIRSLIDAFMSALATSGHEAAAAAIHDRVHAEIVPGVLTTAAAGPARALSGAR